MTIYLQMAAFDAKGVLHDAAGMARRNAAPCHAAHTIDLTYICDENRQLALALICQVTLRALCPGVPDGTCVHSYIRFCVCILSGVTWLLRDLTTPISWLCST